MITRSIVKIDEEKCTGCGQCISPCTQGAIKIINGKAKVISDELCDGLGHCIGVCPEGAISIEQRSTLEFKRSDFKGNEFKESSETVPPGALPQCFKCHSSDDERYLLPLKHKKEDLWVCTQCLPALIHG